MRYGCGAAATSLFLLAWAMILAGGRDGFNLAPLLVGAPWPPQHATLMLALTPATWFLLGLTAQRGPRWLLPSLTFLQWAAVLLLAHQPENEFFPLSPNLRSSALLWCVFYLAGQVLLWRGFRGSFLSARRTLPRANKRRLS